MVVYSSFAKSLERTPEHVKVGGTKAAKWLKAKAVRCALLTYRYGIAGCPPLRAGLRPWGTRCACSLYICAAAFGSPALTALCGGGCAVPNGDTQQQGSGTGGCWAGLQPWTRGPTWQGGSVPQTPVLWCMAMSVNTEVLLPS